MGKKHLKRDEVHTYYAALNGRHIALETVRPTPLEAAARAKELNPPVDGFDPPWQIIEVQIGWNVNATAEMEV